MTAIGVTGHRVLADLDRLHAGMREVVAWLEQTHPDSWTVVSSLAEGADRLVARALLGRPGTTLVAVLPLPVADYEADFGTAQSVAELHELLDQASEVVVVPPQHDRDEAYEAAGLAVLDRSDVLVAVWDGEGAQGVGGTGGIVAEARRRRLPLAWIRAGNRRPGTAEPTTLGEAQGAVSFERLDRVGTGEAT